MSAPARPGRSVEPTAVDLLEDGVRLLRSVPLAAFTPFLLGTVPFLLALLAFVTEMAGSAYAAGRLGEGALLLALLYVAMKTGQALFCRKLREALSLGGVGGPSSARPGLFAVAASQAAIQPWSLFLLPLAALAAIPFGWVYAFFASHAALGAVPAPDAPPGETAESPYRRAARHAAIWPGQNHRLLGLLTLVSLFVFANAAVALAAAPFLLKLLFGVETAFSRAGASGLNTTFLAAAAALAYLVLRPLVLAAYAVRAFRADALTTGEDLLAELKRLAAVALLVLAAAGPATASADGPRAALPAPPPPAVSPAELDRAAEEVLARREFAWRMSRDGVPIAERSGPLADLVDALTTVLKDAGNAVLRFLDRLSEWLSRKLRRDLGEAPDARSRADWAEVLASRGLLFAVLAVLLAALAVALLRRRLRKRASPIAAAPAAAEPDLLSDAVSASEKPADGWLALSEEWLERGDLRRALRALYLAALAALAARSLLVPAPYKSNGEYRRELLRRAHAAPRLAERFAGVVGVFESAWYGREDVTREALEAFRADVVRLAEGDGA